MKPLNHVVATFQESIFTTLAELANRAGVINLAQGFPDFDGPEWVRELGAASMRDGKQQYAASMGAPELRKALSQLYQRQYQLEFDWRSEVLVTVGASEAIYVAIQALTNPGDEVLFFEPFYDSYMASAKMAGVTAKAVTLKFPDFEIDWDALASAVSDKTKLIMFNSPHNPTGKVFTKAELERLAAFVVEHDLYVITDEVYEYLAFDRPHLPLASLPQMAERVLTISSMGKTLGLTGWKIGWVVGPRKLIQAVHALHQYLPFCVVHPLQLALADALPRLPEYLPEFQESYRNKRDFLFSGLKELGFNVQNPQGTYFALSKVPDGRQELEYCQELIQKRKVAALPLSSFYLNSDEGTQLIRFCFAKKQSTLNQAIQNLREP